MTQRFYVSLAATFDGERVLTHVSRRTEGEDIEAARRAAILDFQSQDSDDMDSDVLIDHFYSHGGVIVDSYPVD